MKTFALWTILVLSCAQAGLASTEKPLFAVSPEAKEWLHYIEIRVPFRLSTSIYRFGEVKVLHGTDTVKINLKKTIPADSTFHGDTTRGVQSVLSSKCRTDEFVVPQTGHVSFWRTLVNATLRDSSGTAIGWDVSDTTQFRVLLRRSSDDSVLAVLDSVGTYARMSLGAGDSRYGVEVLRAQHTRTLPPSATGMHVYIQVVPTWYGFEDQGGTGPNCDPPNFPHEGLPMVIRSAPVNFSAAYSDSGSYIVTDSVLADWSQKKYDAQIAFSDSVFTMSGGCLPDLPLGFDSTAQITRYYQRYGFIADTLGDSTVLHRNPHCAPENPLAKASYPIPGGHIDARQQYPLPSELKIISIGTATGAGTLNLVLSASVNISEVSILMSSIDGSVVGAVWKGALAAGRKTVSVQLPTVPSSAYLLKFVGERGKVIGTSHISIVR